MGPARAPLESPPGGEILPWAVDTSGGFLQGPLDLAFVAGRRLDLRLADGVVALLARGGDIRAAYLPGRHLLRVTAPSHPRGSAGAAAAGAFRTDAGDLPAEGQLLFVSTGSDIALSWPARAPVIPAGECALRIADPAAFYRAFLSHAERIGADFVLRVAGTMVVDRLRCLLEADRSAALPGPGDLAPVLEAMGLACRSLSLAPRPVPLPTLDNLPASV